MMTEPLVIIKSDQNAFSKIWDDYLQFEHYSRRRGERLMEFVTQWKEKMISAQTAGCQYSDVLLACKLLEKSNLTNSDIKQIMSSIDTSGPGVLSIMLERLETFSLEFSETTDFDKLELSGNIKDDTTKIYIHRLTSAAEDLDVLPELEIKKEPVDANAFLDISFANLMGEDDDDHHLLNDDDIDDEEFDPNSLMTDKPASKTHTCTKCGRKFSRPSLLRAHALKIHGIELKEERKEYFENLEEGGGETTAYATKIHSCPSCGKIFNRPSLLNSHMFKIHGIEPTKDAGPEGSAQKKIKWHSCPTCEKLFPRPSLVRAHSLKIHGVEIKTEEEIKGHDEIDIQKQSATKWHSCTSCARKFPRPSLLIAHALKIHGITLTKEEFQVPRRKATTKWHPCFVCERTFPRPSLLNAHMFKDHGIKPKKREKKSVVKDEDGNVIKTEEQKKKGKENKVTGQCEFCGKKFTKPWLLQHRNICSLNPKPGSLLTGASMYNSRKPTKCNICGKTFARIYNYKNHLPLHTGEKNFKCEICPAAFTHYSSLAYHKMKHRGERPYKCNLCDKTYLSSNNLVLHKRREHLNERPFQCDQCDQSFVAKKDLQRHSWHHTGETPYKCEFCGKGFKGQKYYKRHLATHAQ